MPAPLTASAFIPENQVGEMFVGFADCLFGLGVAMCDAGVMTRQELAEAFESISEQHQARADCQSQARQLPAKTLAKLFRAIVVTGYS